MRRGPDDRRSTVDPHRRRASHPHANVIAYDVCSGGCPETAIVAGIDQAIADGVDVLNYSIGGDTPSEAWTDPDATGLLNARAAGIHVAASAGNRGPGPGTMGLAR